MWIPLVSKDPISNERQLLEQILIRGGRGGDGFEHHSVFIVDKDLTGSLVYKKIMDARYAKLGSVEEQLGGEV